MAKATLNAGEYSAQRGGAIHKWVNDKQGSGSAEVLTDATLYYNIAVGEVVMITAMHFDVVTLSDDCHFHVVTTTEAAGGGDATDICGHAHIGTGTTFSTTTSKERPFIPPIRIVGSTTIVSITMKINTNDSDCKVSCGWAGYTDLSLGT